MELNSSSPSISYRDGVSRNLELRGELARVGSETKKKTRWRKFSDFQTESGHLLGKMEEEVRSSAPPLFQDPPSGLRVAQRGGDSKE